MAIGANMTKRDQALVAAAILALGAAGAFWYFVYQPKHDAIAAIAAHADSVEAMNRKARIDLREGTTEAFLADAQRYAQHLSLMRQLVPTTNEVPALLEDVSTAARRVGLDLATVEPVPVIEGEQFDTYRYKVSVIGGYHAIAQFLGNVGSLNRIVAPVGAEFKPHAEEKGKSRAKPNESLLEANFQLQTYVARTAPLILSKEESR
jgi:type IV pilus assembly protein PilO